MIVDSLIKPRVGEIYISKTRFNGRYITLNKGDLFIPLKLDDDFRVIKLKHLNSSIEVSSDCNNQESVVLGRKRFMTKQFVLLSQESSKEILEDFNNQIHELTKKVLCIDMYLKSINDGEVDYDC